MSIVANIIPFGSWEPLAFLASVTFWLLLPVPNPHCYTFLFNFLTLYTSPPISSHTWSCTLFPLPLLSSFQVLFTLYLPWLFCSSFYVGLKHPHFDLPSSWTSYGLWIISWVFWAFGLISTYQRVHTMCVILWLSYFTQDDIFYFCTFACEFHEGIVFNGWVVLHCVNVLHFLYPFFCWETSGLFLASGYCK